MKIEIGDKFIKDTKYGRISYKVINILEGRVYYYGEGPTGTMTDNTIWSKTIEYFTWQVERFNARRIPKEEISDIQSYVPRHKFR